MKTFEGRKIIEELQVEGLDGSMNVYDYLPTKLVSIPSRKGVKKAFGRRQVLLNGKVSRSQERIRNGDLIQILEYLGTINKEYDLELNIPFEDECLAVVEKPPGIPTSGNKWKTLQNAMPGNLDRSPHADALSVPLTVHRLDAKTHGLVIVAKTASTRILLGEMFEQRKIRKTYTAIVQGKLIGGGAIDSKIEGKNALSHYNAIEYFAHVKDKWNTIVELNPVTGRKHQLRIHLASIGHPIIGDVKYSDKSDVLKGKGFFLSANKIEFTHPVTNAKLCIQIELPNKFDRYIERMGRWNDRIRTD